MNNSEEQLMLEIQKVGFAVVELGLYLDTHPTDRDALMKYNYFANQLKMLKEKYSRQYGQLDQHGPSYHYPYRWIMPQWPWERGLFMREEEE